VQNLSPIGWALRPLKNYARFSGRASRAEFWWFVLFMVIIYCVVILAAMTMTFGASAIEIRPTFWTPGESLILDIIIGLFWVILFIPVLALEIRRLHDINRSGWWMGGFWTLYIAYMVVGYGLAFLANAANATPPSIVAFAAVWIMAIAFFVYSIVLLVFFCLPGTKGANRFGDDPYGSNIEEVFA
jgi:uncharacterized membrane protein YhaH (DUF805 family)